MVLDEGRDSLGIDPLPRDKPRLVSPSLLRLRLRALSGDTTGPDLAVAGRDAGNDKRSEVVPDQCRQMGATLG